jgi:hypothetical protein
MGFCQTEYEMCDESLEENMVFSKCWMYVVIMIILVCERLWGSSEVTCSYLCYNMFVLFLEKTLCT